MLQLSRLLKNSTCQLRQFPHKVFAIGRFALDALHRSDAGIIHSRVLHIRFVLINQRVHYKFIDK